LLLAAFIWPIAALRRKIGSSKDFLQVSCENQDPRALSAGLPHKGSS
jgi:hypothetical protein